MISSSNSYANVRSALIKPDTEYSVAQTVCAWLGGAVVHSPSIE